MRFPNDESGMIPTAEGIVRIVWVILVASLAAALLGCGAAEVKNDCRTRIDSCMRSCSARSVTTYRDAPDPFDSRSECERGCYRICYP
jgi:hypothetical protein